MLRRRRLRRLRQRVLRLQRGARRGARSGTQISRIYGQRWAGAQHAAAAAAAAASAAPERWGIYAAHAAAAQNAGHAQHGCRLLRRRHLQRDLILCECWDFRDLLKCLCFAYLHADAAVERYLDGIAVIRCLHQRCEVTDADLLQRRLAPAMADAHAGQALAQRRGATQQYIIIDLQVKGNGNFQPKLAEISGQICWANGMKQNVGPNKINTNTHNTNWLQGVFWPNGKHTHISNTLNSSPCRTLDDLIICFILFLLLLFFHPCIFGGCSQHE